MTTAAILTGIVALAALVVLLRSRTQKLSPALRAEYEELAEWAERETNALKRAYDRNTGRAHADGERSRRKEMSATTDLAREPGPPDDELRDWRVRC